MHTAGSTSYYIHRYVFLKRATKTHRFTERAPFYIFSFQLAVYHQLLTLVGLLACSLLAPTRWVCAERRVCMRATLVGASASCDAFCEPGRVNPLLHTPRRSSATTKQTDHSCRCGIAGDAAPPSTEPSPGHLPLPLEADH